MNKLLLVVLIIGCNLESSFGQSWGSLKKEQQPIFTYTVNDTLNFPIFVVQDTNTKAKYYGAKLETNVCSDKVCLPITINLFWDLLGNYDHFSKEPDFKFTKFDHQYFDEKDYERLQEILIDSLSPLRDYAVDDLLDKDANKYSLEIDAVTRPTSALFSNVTVPGALYTVYTLWHIVNGPIKLQLNNYLNKEYRNRKWQSYFSNSHVPGYQEYFLKHLDTSEIEQNKQEIVTLIFAQDEYIPHYALERLKNNILENPTEYNIILRQLDKLKPHVITKLLSLITAPNSETKAILEKFSDSDAASEKHKQLIDKILSYEK